VGLEAPLATLARPETSGFSRLKLLVLSLYSKIIILVVTLILHIGFLKVDCRLHLTQLTQESDKSISSLGIYLNKNDFIGLTSD
jgi:hypothetical protein